MSGIAKILKKRRSQLKLTAKQVAGDIGVAESTYREWELGRSIQGEPYIRIAKVLKISAVELIGGEVNKEKEYLSRELSLVLNHVKNIQEFVITGLKNESQF